VVRESIRYFKAFVQLSILRCRNGACIFKWISVVTVK